MNELRRLRRIVAGERIDGVRGKLNAIVDAVNYDPRPAGASGRENPGFLSQQILWLEIRILNADTLECALPGQQLNPNADTWIVDPPVTITNLSRGGITYVYTDINNRTADGTEVQQLTPVYNVNDLIAVADLEEGTGWRDLNIDGRQWAKVP